MFPMNKLNPATNHRQWEHKAHTTHDKEKPNKAQKTKEMNNLNPTTNQRQWEHKAQTTHVSLVFCALLCLSLSCVPYVPIVSGLL
jgi:hypothetical protein